MRGGAIQFAMVEILHELLAEDVLGRNPALLLWPVTLPVDQILEPSFSHPGIQETTNMLHWGAPSTSEGEHRGVNVCLTLLQQF